MWKVIGTCVQGTSHVKDSLPCQDHCIFLEAAVEDSPVLFIAIADGAGSAKASEIGAEKATEFILGIAKAFDWQNAALTSLVVTEWVQATQAHLRNAAVELNLCVDELACTLLLSVILPTRAYFLQIGDGCWVIQKGEDYVPVTWPCRGEFLNYTKFVTSEDACEHIQFHETDAVVPAVAGFTDGLQMLALNFADQRAHKPFFDLFFSALKATDDPSSLQAPLTSFLNSESVNERTDDDKTLVLACLR